jgi:flagellin
MLAVSSQTLRAIKQMNTNTRFAEKTFEQLSSGLKIVRAADGPVEYSISQKLKQSRMSVVQARTNASNGISILQTTESNLSTIQEHLHRMRELTVQAASDVNGARSRNAISKEIRAIAEEIDRIAASAEFNGTSLLDGTATNQLVQIGPRSATAGNTVDISAGLANAQNDLTGGGIGVIDSGASLTFASLDAIYNPATDAHGLVDNATSRSFLNDLDNAISEVLERRGTIGALENRLAGTVNNLAVYEENLVRSESALRDVEVGPAVSRLATSQLRIESAANVLSRVSQFESNVVQSLLAG